MINFSSEISEVIFDEGVIGESGDMCTLEKSAARILQLGVQKGTVERQQVVDWTSVNGWSVLSLLRNLRVLR